MAGIAAPPGRAVALVAVGHVERRPPGLAADHPGLVRGRELVGGVEAAGVQLELVAEAVEQRRTAGRTERSALELARLAEIVTASMGKTAKVWKMAPWRLRQSRQWQIPTRYGAASTSTRTAPHRHPPV